MKPKLRFQEFAQLFQQDLEHLLDQRMPLYKLANKLPWDALENAFEACYSEVGRPALPTRLMVGLLLLKQLENLSDERVCEMWVQNPYMQYLEGGGGYYNPRAVVWVKNRGATETTVTDMNPWEVFDLNERVPEGWLFGGAHGISDEGIILVQGHRRMANGTWEPRAALLVPVEITIRKQGEEKTPDTGLLVKKDDVLEFALAPQFFDTEDNFETLITWRQRQLKGDGTYTEWSNISEQATGKKFEYTTETGGIFQVKAVITNGGEHEYKRKKDAPYGANWRGVYNENVLSKGKPDFVGVVDEQWQIDLRDEAVSFLGITDYALTKSIRVYRGGPNARPGADKCNIFVYHRCVAAGFPVPLAHSYERRFGLGIVHVPPLANQWGNEWAGSSFPIAGWIFLSNSAMPQPGFIVIRTGNSGSGHMGILNYDGSWINAGPTNVNQAIHLSTGYQPAVFRKHNP